MISYGIHEPATAGLHHLALVGAARLEPLACAARAGGSPCSLPVRSEITNSTLRGGSVRRVAVEQREPHDDLLDAEVARRGREAPREPLRHVGIQEDGGRHEQRDAVPLQPALGIALAEDRAQRARGLVEGVLEGGQVQRGFAPVFGRAAARVGEHEDALVGGHRAAAAVEAVDAVARRDALELEVVEAVEVDAAGRLGMDAEIVGLGAQALRRVHEGAMRERRRPAPRRSA